MALLSKPLTTPAHYAELKLEGATCTSCALGIEHMGRRLKGVQEIEVDRGNATIKLEFDGNPVTIEKIVQFVQAIGYDAKPVGPAVQPDEDATC